MIHVACGMSHAKGPSGLGPFCVVLLRGTTAKAAISGIA